VIAYLSIVVTGAPPLREIPIDEVTCADVRTVSVRAPTRMGNARHGGFGGRAGARGAAWTGRSGP